MPPTSTQALRQDYARVKAECTRLTEALRTFDPSTTDATEAELQAQLVAALLKLKALQARLGHRGARPPT